MRGFRLGQGGFTLLELLVVVFILGAIAFTTTAFTNNSDEQFRFEDTRTRLANIRAASVGQPTQTVNGAPAVNGFVADVGRLPSTLQELVENVGSSSLPVWAFDASVGLWAGWRGPYLTVLSEQSSGMKAFRDGWGNSGMAPNYGWGDFTVTDIDGGSPNEMTDTLTVRTLGSDGASGGSEYAADYPMPGEALVERNDHQLNLRGWRVSVTFDNQGAADYTGAAIVRLRLYSPREGAFAMTWPAAAERDTTPMLSLTQTLPVIGAGASASVSFDFGTTNKFVPWGVRALGVVNDMDGSAFSVGTVTNSNQIVHLIPRTQIPTSTITWRLG